MTKHKWTKGEDGSWLCDDYEVLVVGETSTGKPVRWGIYRNHKVCVEKSFKGNERAMVFDTLKEAKARVGRLIEANMGTSVFVIRSTAGLSEEIIVVPGNYDTRQMEAAYSRARPWTIGHMKIEKINHGIFSAKCEDSALGTILPAITKTLRSFKIGPLR